VKPSEIYAALIAGVIGLPLAFFFTQAISEGHARAKDAPYVALLGNEAFDLLSRGTTTNLHYMGDDRTAPDFTLPDRTGRPWKLSDHRGKVVIMNFWSITCQPCVEEMPSLLELARIAKHRDDVEVISISTDEGWDAVARIFPRDVPLTVLFDSDKAVVDGMHGTRLYPETWVIDPEGVIRLRIDGRRDWSSSIVLQLVEQLTP